MKTDKRNRFIEKANLRHNNKYDYSKVVYVNSQTKVCIICPEHGEFEQTPSAHVRGDGCPMCANKKRGHRSNRDEFISKANKIHNNKYDYSKVIYENADTEVIITCPEHGDFKQTPMNHLKGQGCPKCAGRNKTQEDILKEFIKVHGNTYDYSKVVFNKMHDKVTIICPIHGEFEQTPSKHLKGQGCPKCAQEKRFKKQTLNTKEFVNRSKEMYGDTYDYSEVEYTKMNEKVKIRCKKHGTFEMRPYDHLQGHGCPKCGIIISKAEDEICEYIQGFYKGDIKRNDRSVLGGKEIDIYIPELKFGIEYNGLKWHSEEYGKDCYYHLKKLEECKNNGIKLIQIYEDEYNKNKKLVLEKTRYIMGFSKLYNIMGRKCEIKEISNNISKQFLEENHIQGYAKSTIFMGAYYKDELVAVMSFLNEGNGKWNLTRYASKNCYKCQGVAGKIFKYFLKNNEVRQVKTFADRRWTNNEENNLYIKLGFNLDKILKPDYYYIDSKNPSERIHKFNLRKRTLNNKYGISMDKTESEMVKELGFYKIWNCGLYRYVYTKKEEV